MDLFLWHACAGNVAEQADGQTAQARHDRRSASRAVGVLAQTSVLGVVQAILDLPVPAGQSQKSLGSAIGFLWSPAGQIVVILDDSFESTRHPFAGRSNMNDLAKAWPSSSASVRSVAVAARGAVDPEFVRYDFGSSRSPLFSTVVASGGLLRSWAKAFSASLTSVV